MRALLCTAALTIACAWAPAVFAQDAAALFREGSASFARGDYRAAALAFDAAYRRDPQGATAYNAALAWDATKEAGDQAPAADGYDAAIERGGIEASELEHAKVRLAKLEQVLGRVDVSGPEGARASLAHARDVPLPARIHALPGSYQIRVVFVGDRIETREITLTAGAPLAVTFAEPVETKTAPPVPLRPKPRRVRVETERDPTMLVIAGVSLGVSALAAGAAIGLGVAALDARDAYAESDYTDVDLYDRAGTLRTWTNVAWGAAGVLAVTGGVLLIVALTREEPVTARAAAFRWRF